MAFNVEMQAFTRNGEIKSLWELMRILDQILSPDRDRKNGKQILPICILVSKMFTPMCVCYSEHRDKYYLCYSKYIYDVERIIDCVHPEILNSEIREYIKSDEGIMAYINDIPSAWRDFTYIPNDLEYALVDEDDYEDYKSMDNDILLQDKEVKQFYNELVTRISNHLKLYRFKKYNADGYDVFGYDKEGKDVNGYDVNGCLDSEEDIDEIIWQEIADKYCNTEEYYNELSNFQKNNLEPEILSLENDAFLYYDEEGNVYGESVDNVRKRTEEDYDINYDDLELDYYDSSSYDDPEDPD